MQPIGGIGVGALERQEPPPAARHGTGRHRRLGQEPALMSHLLDAASDMLLAHDLEGNFLYVNETACRALGYPREALLQMNLKQLVTEQPFFLLIRDWLGEFPKTGSVLLEPSDYRKDGLRLPVEVNVRVLRLGEAQIALSVIRDAKRSGQAETARYSSEESLAKVFYASPNVVAVIRLSDGVILNVNDSWTRVTGFSREESLGSTVLGLITYVYPTDWFRATRIIQEQDALHNEEVRFVTKHGIVRHALVSAKPIDWRGERCLLVVATDITGRRILEPEIVQLDRLDLFMDTAASIAHEIRNPLAAARGFTQLIGEKAESAPYRRYLDLIIQELDRANTIISEFLALARNRPARFRIQNILTPRSR